MEAHGLGPWTPMAVAGTVELFHPAGFPWWLSGGHALEADLDRSWRGHDDTDIDSCRSDTAGRPDSPWMIDITDGDDDEHEWIYRRHPAIRHPWLRIAQGNAR